MNLSSNTALNTWISSSSIPATSSTDFPSLSLSLSIAFPRNTLRASQSVCARKTRSEPDDSRILSAAIVEDVSLDDEEDEEFVEEDEEGVDYVEDEDDDFDYVEDECEDEAETLAGDGGAGGGISLAGMWWDKKALEIAQQVSLSFDGLLDIYAFKTLPNSAIRVRIENLSKKSGSPNMEDIKAFTIAYRARLDEAELAKTIPENIILEVSSPGVERAVRIPKDLERFKDRAMYVRYYVSQAGESVESDGIFSLISYDTETKCCTWGLANVRANREKAGKGRPLNKKQREWRLDTPFESLRLVRLHSDI